MVQKIISDYRVMAINDEIGLLYHKGCLYRQDFSNDSNPVFLCDLPLQGIKKCLVKLRITERMLRIEPRVAIALGEQEFLLSCAGKIFRINLSDGRLVEEFKLREGMNNPLSFTKLGDGSILFGEYFSNNRHESVRIVQRRGQDWSCVYTFPPNTVYHIHGIVADNDRVYVLTGDSDSESAIWYTGNHFKTLEKIVGGKQEYRACVAFPYKEGLVYATDTPLESNYLYYLHNTCGVWETKILYEMPGPCIYGTCRKNAYYFATSVEPDARLEDTLRYNFTYKLGKGVKDRYSHIIRLEKDGEISEVCKFRKDVWPMLLMQFGNCLFPDTDNEEVLVAPMSVKKYDGKTFRI